MATGDYHHTALAVAWGVGMVPPGGQVIIIQNAAEVRVAHLHHKHSVLKSAASTPRGRPARQISFAPDMVETRESEYQGLVFRVDNGNAVQDDALEALTAIAQVVESFVRLGLLKSKIPQG